MAYEYQREKVGGLLKGLLAAVGATAGGILLGGKAAGGQQYQQYQQYTDPDEAIEALEKEVQIELDCWEFPFKHKSTEITSTTTTFT